MENSLSPRASKEEPLQDCGTDALSTLVWTVKSWMGVQGVRKEVRTIAARALLSMPWSQESFEESIETSQTNASELVSGLVEKRIEFGSERREFSLASKVLHWLLPWRVPIFDSFVRSFLKIPTAWSTHDSYRAIVDWETAVARQLMTQDAAWIGDLEPKSPLHALDKYLWWKGGGDVGRAVVVRDPWKVIQRLRAAPTNRNRNA